MDIHSFPLRDLNCAPGLHALPDRAANVVGICNVYTKSSGQNSQSTDFQLHKSCVVIVT